MTFIPEDKIEALAAALWHEYELEPGFDVEQLVDDLGLGLIWEAVDDEDDATVLGQLVPEGRLVVLNERHLDRLEERGGRLRRYTLGHEIGHWLLHAQAERSGNLRLFDGGRTWCRSGSSDPVERQAEIFSAALLMPIDHLRQAVPKRPWHGWAPVYRLADLFIVNVTPMTIRLERLGWMHRDASGTPVSGPDRSTLQAVLFQP
jgi:IrrE N-terminal-like domain